MSSATATSGRAAAEGERLRLLDQPRRHRRDAGSPAGLGCGCGRPISGLSVPAFGVEGEQRLGHLRLHAEHVDQEAERAQVAGETVEGAGLRRVRRIDLGRQQHVDVVAHAQHGLRGLVEAEHRQHAAHRGELARYRHQDPRVARAAEVLVDQLL